MAKTPAERQSDRRERLRQSRQAQVVVTLDSAAHAALMRLCVARPGSTYSDIIGDMLKRQSARASALGPVEEMLSRGADGVYRPEGSFTRQAEVASES